LLALSVLAQAAFLLIGGFVGDISASWRPLRWALLGLAATSILGLLLPPTGLELIDRLIAWVCTGVIIPVAIGTIAILYRGSARALALGIAYSVMGLSVAVAPALAAAGPPGSALPAFVACALASVGAWWAWRRPAIATPSHARGARPVAARVALGAFGVIATISGLFDFGDVHVGLRVILVAVGISSVLLAWWLRGRSGRPRGPHVAAAGVIVALAIGAAVGFAQAVPLLHLPLFFQIVQGASPLAALLGIVPFGIALLVAGPVSETLIRAYAPRTIICGGVAAVGIADVLLAAVIDRTTPYVMFVVPLVLVGAGFVISTSVRTALIFASMPSQLPSSAAALNEASVGLGSRIGVVVATVVMTTWAAEVFRDSPLAGMTGSLDALADRFREVLGSIGLPAFDSAIEGLGPEVMSAYIAAATDGIRLSLLLAGSVAMLTAAVAYPLLARVAPLVTTWDLADERRAGPSTSVAAERGDADAD
jgi:hypothetical protein